MIGDCVVIELLLRVILACPDGTSAEVWERGGEVGTCEATDCVLREEGCSVERVDRHTAYLWCGETSQVVTHTKGE